ncbi:MAG: L,D-transpeptidase family protein [Coriobacteriales bacterium]|nr:L,D-transpeptidase family protein [Coriobacteriales bacterium]
MAYTNNDERVPQKSAGHGFWGKTHAEKIAEDAQHNSEDLPAMDEASEPVEAERILEPAEPEVPESDTAEPIEPDEMVEPAEIEPVEPLEAESGEYEPAAEETNPYAEGEWEESLQDSPEDDDSWLGLSRNLERQQRRGSERDAHVSWPKSVGEERISQQETEQPWESVADEVDLDVEQEREANERVDAFEADDAAEATSPMQDEAVGGQESEAPVSEQPTPGRSMVEFQRPQRIDVDGDYRLEPENRAAYDDPTLSHVGFTANWDGSAPAGERGEVTSYLSGPPVGLSKRGKRIRIAAVVACVVVTLAVLYGLGVHRFSNRYLPNTSINSCDVSGKTADEAKAAIDSETKRYACAVNTGDFSMTVTGSDIGLTRNASQLVDQTQGKQNAFLWPFSILVPTRFTPDHGAKYDEETLSALVSRAVDSYNDQKLPSDNVSVQFNESTESYELKGDVKGSAVDEETVESAILESVRSLAPSCSPDAGNAFRAAKPSDLPDYRNIVDHANDVRTNDINILADGNVVAVSPAEQNAAWITVEATKGTAPKIVVDQDGVQLWAEGTVSPAAYHTDDWNAHLLDTETFVDEFCDRLSQGNIDDYDVPLIDERTREGLSRDKAYEHSSWQKEMGRYIDVDLTSQFARLFDNKGEVLWESAFVSGDLLDGHSTVEGTFTIYSKELGTTLVGLDYDMDGFPDYESYVNYWMPFYGGYGLHDATWRSAFGGDLYQYDGSHGCVNLPYEKAKELFAITYVGEVVYVHE